MLKSLVACLVAIVCVGCSTAEKGGERFRDQALSLVDKIRTSPGTPCADPKLEAERSSARTNELHAVDTFEKVVKSEPLSLKDLDTALTALTAASEKFMDVQAECLTGNAQPL